MLTFEHCGKSTGDQGATTSGAGTTAVTSKLSQSELNVLKTMFAVIVCFILGNSVPRIGVLLAYLNVSQMCQMCPFDQLNSRGWPFLFGTKRAAWFLLQESWRF